MCEVFYLTIENEEICSDNAISKNALYNAEHFYSNDLLMYVFINKYGMDRKKIKIERGRFGKPYLVDHYKHIHFNLSHSDRCIALAISSSEIGIDLERIEKI